MSDKTIQEKLEVVKKSYAASLKEKSSAIKENWETLCSKWDQDVLHQLHIIVHGLAGSAETFGFVEITTEARGIVDKLKQLDKNRPPDAKTMEELTNNIISFTKRLNESADLK